MLSDSSHGLPLKLTTKIVGALQHVTHLEVVLESQDFATKSVGCVSVSKRSELLLESKVVRLTVHLWSASHMK